MTRDEKAKIIGEKLKDAYYNGTAIRCEVWERLGLIALKESERLNGEVPIPRAPAEGE